MENHIGRDLNISKFIRIVHFSSFSNHSSLADSAYKPLLEESCALIIELMLHGSGLLVKMIQQLCNKMSREQAQELNSNARHEHNDQHDGFQCKNKNIDDFSASNGNNGEIVAVMYPECVDLIVAIFWCFRYV